MTVLKITEWDKLSETSPGWKSVQELEGIIENPSSIPPEYFNEEIITAYLFALSYLLSESSQHPGVLGYHVIRGTAEEVFTVVEFDTIADLELLDASNNSNVFYNDTFVPARTALLGLFDVEMILHPPVESSQPANEMTAEDVKNLVE